MKASALRIGNLVYIDNEKYHYKLKNIPLSVRSIDYNRDCNNKNTHSVGLSHINQKENTYYESPAQFIKFIEPIPLTEEWLIKFGFEQLGNVIINEFEYYQRWVLHNIIDGSSNFEVHIIYDNYGGGKIYEKEICFSIDNNERQKVACTDYVHNLQNAFHLALGEELTHE